jgi:hypothetical protein
MIGLNNARSSLIFNSKVFTMIDEFALIFIFFDISHCSYPNEDLLDKLEVEKLIAKVRL